MKNYYIYEHHGLKILYVDLTNLKEESPVKEILSESKKYVRKKHPSNKSLHTIINIEGMVLTADIKDSFLEFITGNSDRVKYTLFTGVDIINHIVYKELVKADREDVICVEELSEAEEFLLYHTGKKSRHQQYPSYNS
ncbi:hypothetical protein QA597_08165 [Marinilabiliaceae bacterium ANBcel2]|nr:hypothetical protein [Marinilabiliaceae bacterium ANBcel2]